MKQNYFSFLDRNWNLLRGLLLVMIPFLLAFIDTGIKNKNASPQLSQYASQPILFEVADSTYTVEVPTRGSESIVSNAFHNSRNNRTIAPPDPIRFRIRSEAKAAETGKPIKLIITAFLTDLHPNYVNFYEHWTGYTLKLLIPKGFVVTGGTYSDYVTGKFSLSGNREANYTMEGYFENVPENPCFELLRGWADAGDQSNFILANTLCLEAVSPQIDSTHSNARIAACNFTVATADASLACGQAGSVTLTAYVNTADTNAYTYVWNGPGIANQSTPEKYALPDTLTKNTSQTGLKKDTASTIVYFKAGFAVAPGGDYTATIARGGQRHSDLEATQPGTYTVTVTNPLTNCSITDTAVVHQTGGPSVILTASGTTLNCNTDSIKIRATSSPAGLTYSWTGPGITATTADSIYAKVAGTYTVTVSAAGTACTASDAIVIAQNSTQPVITLAANDTLPCTGSLVLRPTVTPANATYSWTGPGISQPVISDTLAVTTAGTYLLTATHPTSGCTEVDSIVVADNPNCTLADSSCFVFVKAVDAFNTETVRLPRGSGSAVWGNLTLTTEDLDSIPTWDSGVTRQWLLPDSTTITAPSITANQIGVYEVTLTKGGQTCKADIILTGTSCHSGDTTYACNPNAAAAVVPDDPAHYLKNLTPGDTIFAGDFIAIVLQVDEGSAGTGWTGSAKVKVPYLGGAELSATFTNAKVNDCYELISGSRIETVFDPNAGGILDVDDLVGSISALILELSDAIDQKDATAINKVKIDYLAMIPQLNGDTLLTQVQKDKAVSKINNIATKIDELISSSCFCENCGPVNGRLAAVEKTNAESCEILQNNILQENYLLIENLGGGSLFCTASKPTVAGVDGQLMNVTGRRKFAGIDIGECTKTWIYVDKIGNIKVIESGWYEDIEVVLDQQFNSEIPNYSSSYAIGPDLTITNLRKRTVQSQWYERDRSCLCRTFVEAAKYNTENNNFVYYKPISQINDYYKWAIREIDAKVIGSNIKFFHAAENVTSFTTVGGAFYVPFISGLSDQARKSLADVNAILIEANMPVIKDLINTGHSNKVSGNGIIWDFNYVPFEQGNVTQHLSAHPLSDLDVKVLNEAFSRYFLLHPEFTLAKYLIGGNKLNYKIEAHRIAIGRSLVLLKHLEANKSFYFTEEYAQAKSYLEAKYGTYNAHKVHNYILDNLNAIK